MSTISPPLRDADYEAIEAAVMETARGRWFLAEYARRNRHADTTMLLTALDRFESALRGERSIQTVDRIRFDLVDMAKAIARTKKEIAAIKPDIERPGKMGEAQEELNSIVRATEIATSEILAAAERLQEIAWALRDQGLDSVICDALDARTTEVFTACSFQDLTGQRTGKVIDVLGYLERRIDAMIRIWGLDGALPTDADDASSQPPAEIAERGAELGPHAGLAQADVDRMMAPGATTSESAAAIPLQPAAEPMAAHPARANGALAALDALSYERKIALFS